MGETEGPWQSVSLGGLTRWLGGAVDAVVLDLHDGLDLDALGRAHGLIRGGGSLILRLPIETPRRDALAPWPFTARDVGTESWERLEHALERTWRPGRKSTSAQDDVQALSALRSWLEGPAGSIRAVLGRRGRGKSTTLGRALSGASGLVITGPTPASVAQLRRTLGADAPPWTPPVLALRAPGSVLCVDEAAQLPVALLSGLARAWEGRHRLFATTTDGYEGTGQGFRLRFLDRHDAVRHTLTTPRRWAPGDPLEAFVDHLLLTETTPVTASTRALRHAVLPHALGPRDLAEVVGLLRQAHYRTTPGDIERLLDAPNLTLHALLADTGIVAVNLVATEGDLPAQVIDDLQLRGRIRGHALPDTLVCHAGAADAGSVPWIRSVRIAVHPDLRRRGLATRLATAVQRYHAGRTFGTVFSADAGVIRFRRSLGYRVVRLGVAASARTGGVSVVMARPSPSTLPLIARLRGDLARDLPCLVRRLAADLGPGLDTAALACIEEGLGPAAPLSDTERDAAVRAIATGPRPADTAPTALRAWLTLHADDLATCPEADQALLRARLLDDLSWSDTAEVAGMDAPHHAQKALKRALRALYTRVMSP